MHDAFIVHETWVFQCMTCLNIWDVEYEAWHAGDGHGGDVVSYHKRGQPCTVPWSGMICPNCNGYAVKPLPSRTTVRSVHPAPEHSGPAEPTLFRLARVHAY